MKRLLAVWLLYLLVPALAFAFDLSAYEIDEAAGTAADLTASHIEDRLSLEGHPYRLFSYGGVYIGFHETEGEPAQFMLYDKALNCFARGQLPSERAELCSLHDDGNAILLSLVLPMKPTAQLLCARIGKDGQLLWQYMADYDTLHSTVAFPDGAGGAWLGAQANDPFDYDPYAGTRLTHVNHRGEIESSRVLKTGKEILLIHSAISHPESGCVTLYASLVAKSKGVYTALAATLDPAGNILNTKACDFSMSADTAFGFRIDADGKPWVYSRGGLYAGGKSILVPFDDLPALSPPKLHFQ